MRLHVVGHPLQSHTRGVAVHRRILSENVSAGTEALVECPRQAGHPGEMRRHSLTETNGVAKEKDPDPRLIGQVSLRRGAHRYATVG